MSCEWVSVLQGREEMDGCDPLGNTSLYVSPLTTLSLGECPKLPLWAWVVGNMALRVGMRIAGQILDAPKFQGNAFPQLLWVGVCHSFAHIWAA